MLSNWYPWGLFLPNNYVLMMLNLEIFYLLKMFILRKLDIIFKETSSRVIHVTAARWTRLGKNVIAPAKGLPIEFFSNILLSCPKLQPLWVSLRGWKHIYLYSTYCVTGSLYGKIWFCPFQCDFCCSKLFFLQILGRIWPLTMMAK